MKIWIVGARGMLGSQLSLDCAEKGWDRVLSDRDVDITSWEALQKYCPSQKPDLLVNCAAYTAVDLAETDQDKARSLNADGPANLARLAKSKEIPLIHISTDYVVQGQSPEPVREDESYNPINYYGRTKMWGEMAVKERWNRHLILRTAWLYGPRGKNFVDTMLNLMRTKDQISVVSDQFGSPTSSFELSRVIVEIAEKIGIHKTSGGNTTNSATVASNFPWGIYNVSGEGQCSWYDFACEIRTQALELGLLSHAAEVLPVNSDAFPTPAKRPAWSVMSKQKLQDDLGVKLLDWKTALWEYLQGVAAESEAVT